MKMWKAFYSDGKCLYQYDINGKSGYENIDRSKLQAFAIIDKTYVPDRNILVPLMNERGEIFQEVAWHVPMEQNIGMIHLEPGQRLIYRRIGSKQFHTGTQTTTDGPATYMLGWQQNIAGRNVQSILYLTENNGVHQTGKFALGQPNLTKEELG